MILIISVEFWGESNKYAYTLAIVSCSFGVKVHVVFHLVIESFPVTI